MDITHDYNGAILALKERIKSLEEGLHQIKEVALASEGAQFYANLADVTLGFDKAKREEAKVTFSDLSSLTYGEHVWKGDD
jgi:hypothetical protein|tara:strand:+ start:1669 stop:1911 length:243 start_codon:yes stop_codon:yes gene_type:complete